MNGVSHTWSCTVISGRCESRECRGSGPFPSCSLLLCDGGQAGPVSLHGSGWVYSGQRSPSPTGCGWCFGAGPPIG